MPLLLLKWSLQFLLFCCWRHINRLLDTAFPNKTFLGAFSIISGFPDETTSFVIYLPQVKSVVKVRNDKTFLKSEINISSHGIYPFLLSSPITCQLYWMSVGMTITMLLVRCLGQTFFFIFEIGRSMLNVSDSFWKQLYQGLCGQGALLLPCVLFAH